MTTPRCRCRRTQPLLVAGEAAADLGLQCGGWSIEWLGSRGAITPGTTLLQGLSDAGYELIYTADGSGGPQQVPLALVVLAEEPYAEGLGDRGDLALTPAQLALLRRVRARAARLVLLLYSGRPLILGPALRSVRRHGRRLAAGHGRGRHGRRA